MGTWHWDLIRQQLVWSDELKDAPRTEPQRCLTAGAGTGLIHPDDLDQVMRGSMAVMDSDAESARQEHRAVAGDGRIFWVHSRGRIERDAAGKADRMVGITMDVTDRQRSEDALRRTEKLAAAGRLAATVAHEINNPLESIVNLVYSRATRRGLPEQAAGFLATADEELIRIAQIVRQTLGFYRESVDPRISDICRLVAETLAAYRPRIQVPILTTANGLRAGALRVDSPGRVEAGSREPD